MMQCQPEIGTYHLPYNEQMRYVLSHDRRFSQCTYCKLLHGYLQEFMWIDRFEDNAFNNFCYHISI